MGVDGSILRVFWVFLCTFMKVQIEGLAAVSFSAIIDIFFWTIQGTFWDHFWVNFGAKMAAFVGDFGPFLGSFRCHFWVTLEHFGIVLPSFWCRFCVVLTTFWVILGPFWWVFWPFSWRFFWGHFFYTKTLSFVAEFLSKKLCGDPKTLF